MGGNQILYLFRTSFYRKSYRQIATNLTVEVLCHMNVKKKTTAEKQEWFNEKTAAVSPEIPNLMLKSIAEISNALDEPLVRVTD